MPHIVCLFIGVWIVAFVFWSLEVIVYGANHSIDGIDWILSTVILATFSAVAFLTVRWAIILCFSGR